MFWNIITFFKYLNFNKLNFNQKRNTDKIILVEFPDLKSFAISSSYFSHALCKIHNAKPYLYFPNFLKFKNKIKLILQFLNPFSCINIFKSFTNKIIIPQKNLELLKNKKKITKYFKKIKNKESFLKLKYRGILIGDLLYDEYLARFNLPTININSKEFKNFFYESFLLIFYWEEFFKKNKTKSIILSHSVYIMGLVGRIGISKKIDVYVVAPKSHYKLTKNKFIKWNDHYEYPSQFRKYPKKTKIKLLNDAKKNLNLRFSGKEDVRYKIARPIKSVFSNTQIYKNKNRGKNKNILIAAHCFMDAPHVYGDMIFNDFFDWLTFLGKITTKKKYDKNINWYIKVHPSLYDRNIKIFQRFIEKFPKFKLVDKFETHNFLINNIGIDAVLTVYGSIAHEYPLFNIPVLNAGTNPHMGYKFSITPKSKLDYENFIDNLLSKNKKMKIQKKQIYEFYAMHHLIDYDFFESLNIVYDQKLSNKINVLCEYIKKTNLKKHNNMIRIYEKFINSKSRRLTSIAI